MNIICETFGHKFRTVIHNNNFYLSEYYPHSYPQELEQPICKRCGYVVDVKVKNWRENERNA